MLEEFKANETPFREALRRVFSELRIEKAGVPECGVPVEGVSPSKRFWRTKRAQFSKDYRSKYGGLSRTLSFVEPNTATTPIELHRIAVSMEKTIKAMTRKAARAVGGKADFGPGGKSAVKSLKSLSDKVLKRKRILGEVGDSLRSTILVENMKDVKGAVQSVRNTIGKFGGKVSVIDDKYAKFVKSGYGAVHLDVVFKTPAGQIIRAEVQVHVRNVWAVKEKSHAIYEVIRTRYKRVPGRYTEQSTKMFMERMEKALIAKMLKLLGLYKH